MQNPSFVEYEDLLKELHRLIAAGRGDGPEAEALSDRMEIPEGDLAAEEMARLNGLSADLYMLQADEIYEPLPESERTRDHLGAALKGAWDQRNWACALALLRKGPIFLTPPQVAYLRYRAYAELGHLDTARLFLEHAAKLDPENVTYRSLVLDLLQRTGRLGEAVERAEAALGDTRTPAVLRLEAAGILVRAAEGMTESDALRSYQRAIEILEATLAEASPRDVAPEPLAAGYVWLGTCYQLLGRVEEARRAYDRALEIYPEYDWALVARGVLRADADPQGALEDFEHAVRVGTTLVIAYIYLIEASLAHDDYRGCVDLCAHVLRLTQRPELVAAALQATAIAGFHLGLPAEGVRANLRAAVDIDPFNEGARRNLEELDRTLATNAGRQQTAFSWQVPVPPGRQEALRELQEHRPRPACA